MFKLDFRRKMSVNMLERYLAKSTKKILRLEEKKGHLCLEVEELEEDLEREMYDD